MVRRCVRRANVRWCTFEPRTFGRTIASPHRRHHRTSRDRDGVLRHEHGSDRPGKHPRGARRLSACYLRGSRKHLPRESDPVPCCGEHMLFRVGELRERRFGDDICGRASRWHPSVLSALRTGGPPPGGYRPRNRHWAPGRPLPDVADLAEQWYKNVAKTTATFDFHIVH